MDSRMLVVAALMCGCVIGGNGDRCYYDQNGCSTGVTLPFRRTFSPACRKHDLCYSCGWVHGLSRRDCDRRFSSDMRGICLSRGLWCRLWRRAYYVGVRLAGHLHYHGNDPRYDCQSERVNDCLKR